MGDFRNCYIYRFLIDTVCLCAETGEKNQQVVALCMFDDLAVMLVVELVHETVVYIASLDLSSLFAEQVDYIVFLAVDLTCIHWIDPRLNCFM